METQALFRSKWMIMAGMILLLPLLAGCLDDGLPEEEGAEISLSRVPDNSVFASLPLMGTRWKLLGFVDGKSNRIKMAKPGDGESFTQIFEEDGSFTGRAAVNLAQGEYFLNNNQLSIPEYHLMTEAGEMYDGPL